MTRSSSSLPYVLPDCSMSMTLRLPVLANLLPHITCDLHAAGVQSVVWVPFARHPRSWRGNYQPIPTWTGAAPPLKFLEQLTGQKTALVDVILEVGEKAVERYHKNPAEGPPRLVIFTDGADNVSRMMRKGTDQHTVKLLVDTMRHDGLTIAVVGLVSPLQEPGLRQLISLLSVTDYRIFTYPNGDDAEADRLVPDCVREVTSFAK